ncbi:MAG: TetR/AcrR family transcriptional regulator [Alphaproteobacteria bacterium]
MVWVDRARRGVPRRDSAGKRQAIMDAALRLFVDIGYERTRVGDICDASGFSTGSVYHFFGSKAEIAAELCAFAARDWADAVSAPLRDAPTAETAIRGYVHAFFHWVRAHGALYNFINDHRVEAAASEAMREIARAHAGVDRLLAERLAAEAAAGIVRTLPTPISRALLDGPCTCQLIRWARNREDLADTAEEVATAAWHALAADRAPAVDRIHPIFGRTIPGKVDAALVERMGRAGARGAQTRERILAVSMTCFGEAGFERTSILDIARRSEIAVGTIYHHFGSKDGIAAAWCLEGWRDWHGTLQRAIQAERDPRAVVRGMALGLFEWARVNVDLYSFIYDLRRVVIARPRVGAFEAVRLQTVRALQAAMAGPIARGEVRRMSSQALMAVINGMSLGYLIPWSLRRDDWGDAPEVIAEAIWRAVDSASPVATRGAPAEHAISKAS